MQRVLSMLALAGSLALATAQPMLSLSSIKALDTTESDKDRWSFKGRLDGANNSYVLAVGEFGIVAEIEDATSNALDTVLFTPAQCKLLENEKGFACKIQGAARLSVRKAVSKTATAVVKADNKTSHDKPDIETFPYYKVSGSFRRREFAEDPVLTPLTVLFSVDGTEIGSTRDCAEKELVGGKVRFSCKAAPPPTSAPTVAPTP